MFACDKNGFLIDIKNVRLEKFDLKWAKHILVQSVHSCKKNVSLQLKIDNFLSISKYFFLSDNNNRYNENRFDDLKTNLKKSPSQRKRKHAVTLL